MIRIENEEVFGWEASIRGMRNPMNSHNKSDSDYCYALDNIMRCRQDDCYFYDKCDKGMQTFIVGENDLKLMKQLRKAGSDHAKYLRMINVTADILAPLYWWKEYDTYKVGTVSNSCSSMHKIHDKEFTLDDFSCEKLLGTYWDNNENEYIKTIIEKNNSFNEPRVDVSDIESDNELLLEPLSLFKHTIEMLNRCRLAYLKETDTDVKKLYWWQMIQLLPSSYNQRRTIQLNYAVLLNIYHARKNHKLYEWHTFCDWIEDLPYFKEICLDD